MAKKIKVFEFVIFLFILFLSACSGSGKNTQNSQNLDDQDIDRSIINRLSVVNGSGSGLYFKGQRIPIVASSESNDGKFLRWDGDVSAVENPLADTTTVKMPAAPVNVTALFEGDTPLPNKFTLNVQNGSGSGLYSPNQKISIKANPPGLGMEFANWIGAVSFIENINSLETTVTMPSENINVAANYRTLSAKYNLTVGRGLGDGQYAAGSQVTISADPDSPGSKFQGWDDISGQINNSTNRVETITMPANDLTINAKFNGNGPTTGKELLGIVNHIVDAKKVKLLKEGNFVWSRIGIDWFQTRDPCGQMLPNTQMTTNVRSAIAQGIKIFATLAYGPKCASIQNTDNKFINDVPRKDLWIKFVENTVAHYRSLGIKHFGLWNEPNLPQFFEGTTDQAIDIFYIAGIPAVKRGCARAGFNDCMALGPELAHLKGYDKFLRRTIERLQKANITFDIWTHHIYNHVNAPIFDGDSFLTALEKPRMFQSKDPFLVVLKEFGLASSTESFVPVWLSEIGYNTNRDNPSNEDIKQRDEIKAVVELVEKRQWIKKLFIYQLVDSLDPQYAGWGITYQNSSGQNIKKPAFNYVQSYLAK